jgi:catechol 2,3-dioxygenase-like lactoylglutathione lyase family enzyme
MTPLRLDHVTLTSTSLGRSVAFFEEVLDLRPGLRPDLGVGGAWLYAPGGDYPILHIIDRKPDGRPTGAFDHFAFRSDGLLDFLERLRAKAVAFIAKPVPETPYTQVHFFEPDGVKIEVIFTERVDPALLV